MVSKENVSLLHFLLVPSCLVQKECGLGATSLDVLDSIEERGIPFRSVSIVAADMKRRGKQAGPLNPARIKIELAWGVSGHRGIMA